MEGHLWCDHFDSIFRNLGRSPDERSSKLIFPMRNENAVTIIFFLFFLMELSLQQLASYLSVSNGMKINFNSPLNLTDLSGGMYWTKDFFSVSARNANSPQLVGFNVFAKMMKSSMVRWFSIQLIYSTGLPGNKRFLLYDIVGWLFRYLERNCWHTGEVPEPGELLCQPGTQDQPQVRQNEQNAF